MADNSEKKTTFFGGAAVLAAGAIIVKLIGALYKIPLGNVLTNEAYSDFNTAYNVYNFFLVLSTAGLPIALSKTVAEANALGRRNQVDRCLKVAMTVFLILGGVSLLGMTVFGKPLAVAMGNEAAVYCIMALAPSAFCVCVMAAFRGFTQGHGNMMPTTVSQVIEALCKLIIGLALAYAMLRYFPAEEKFRQRMAAVGAIIGISVGSILAMIYLVIRSHKDRGRLSPGADRADDNRTILRTLLRLAIPITVGNAATSVVTLVDTSIVNHLLQRMFENMPELITAEAYAQELVENGLPATLYMARGLKGIYDKCMGVYNLPSAMMMPLTISVVPAVSACLARRDHKGASRITESVLRVGAMLAMPAGIGICALGGPITELLFPGKMDTSIAGPIMSTLGIASIFVCTMLLCTSILQGHGIVNLPAATVVIGGIVKVIVNYILVGNPEINVKGAPYGTMCCFAVVTILDMIIIKRILPVPPSYVRAFGKPLVASVLMGLTAWAGNGLMSRVLLKMSAFRRVSEAGVAVLSGTGNAIATLGAVFLGVVVYAVLIVVLHVVSKEDLELMPKGDKIAKILHIR